MKPSEVLARIPDQFKTALSSNALLFFPSNVHFHTDIGVEFEIRLCPALQKKPDAAQQQQIRDADEEGVAAAVQPHTVDPFAPPYIPELFVGDLTLDDEGSSTEYVVLLNKFSVVPHHFLLVTKEYQSQNAPLLPADLAQTYLLLLAARQAGQHLMAFYNCGPHSGASQPHKHIQFIHVDSGGPPIDKLARRAVVERPDTPFAIRLLPYAHHVVRLPAFSVDVTPSELGQALIPRFLALLDLLISTVRHDKDYPTGQPSYNAILTLEHMHLIPRRHESHALPGTDVVLSVNSLGYAGYMLAKSESELEGIKKVGPGAVLKATGVGSVHELQVAGTSLEAEGHDI